MATATQIVGVVGSYRKNGTIDTAVSALLDEAARQGAVVQKVYLMDQRIEFCTNCRSCMQVLGPRRGACIFDDDMGPLLDAIERADGVVIGAPVNLNNLNALTRRFMERCVGFGYWPWGSMMPKIRAATASKRIVFVCASGAPAWLGRYFSGAMGAFKQLAKLFSAKPVGVLWIGLVNQPEITLPTKARRKAVTLARQLLT